MTTVAATAPLAEGSQRRRRFRPGLRVRIIISFAVGALLLSALLSGSVLGLTRSNIVDQRESTATGLLYSNAARVASTLGESNVQDVLAALPTPTGSRPVIYTEELGFQGQSTRFGEQSLPLSLRQTVLAGQPARMRYVLDGEKRFAVGVPLPAIEGAYFETVSLEDLDETVVSLGLTLLGASILTTLAGAALGGYASRRVLRPVSEVGRAAEAIATGALDTRLEERFDPDLDPLVRSFNGMVSALALRIEKDARFASDVSHELRSPLMTLQASLAVLENSRGELNERAAAALDLLHGDLDRFRQLVEDLLEISRFDAGVTHLERDEVLAGEFVRAAVRAAGYADVPVELAENVVGTVLELDKRRIGRVIANLLDNAANYGGGATRVAVEREASLIRVAVEDEGPGVPVEARPLIFERFARGLSANRRSGSEGVGLGLSLVAEHVRLHGGDIWVEDRPDGRPGARFVFELPDASTVHELVRTRPEAMA